MSITRKALVFLALTFAISWGITIGGWAAGFARNPQMGILVMTMMMAGPAIAATICAFAFEKGQRVEALGLRFKPNLWWIYAWLIPLGLAAASIATTVLISGHSYVDPGTAAVTIAEAQGQDVSQVPPFFLTTTFLLLMSVLNGAAINAPILTFTEELGRRGSLHYLWRPSVFWRASLGTGAIWGIWHAPAILFFGLNYPGNAAIGIGLFVVWCMLLAPLITLVRDRGGSVWAAGIFHGTVNAVAGLTILTVSNPAFPWNGMVGIGGFVALAFGVLVVFVLQRRATAAT
jgi:hypothetical protein